MWHLLVLAVAVAAAFALLAVMVAGMAVAVPLTTFMRWRTSAPNSGTKLRRPNGTFVGHRQQVAPTRNHHA